MSSSRKTPHLYWFLEEERLSTSRVRRTTYWLETQRWFFPFFPSPGQKGTAAAATTRAASTRECFMFVQCKI